jgi:hypothetical protein
MMVQATIVKMEKLVMEEEAVEGIEVLHMGEEEVGIAEILAMKSLMMKMLIIVPNFIFITDVLEEAIMKIGLVN